MRRTYECGTKARLSFFGGSPVNICKLIKAVRAEIS